MHRSLLCLVVTSGLLLAACTSAPDESAAPITTRTSIAPDSTTATPAPETTTTVTSSAPSTTTTTTAPTTTTAITQTEPEPAAPGLVVTDPVYGGSVAADAYRFRGTTDPGCTVTAAGTYEASVDAEGNWAITLMLNPGGNVATFVATNPEGRTTEVRHPVYYVELPAAAAGTWQRWAKTNRIERNGITVGPDGDVWVATEGGLVRWHVATDTYTEVRDPSWPEPTTSSVVFGPEGDMWLGFFTEVLRWDGETWTSYPFTPQSEDWGWIQLAVGPNGDIWAGAKHFGIHRFTDGGWRLVDDSLPGRGDLDTMAVDVHGRVWMGTFWSGLWARDDDGWSQEHTWPVPIVSPAANGDVWYSIRDMRDMSNQRSSVVRIHGLTSERTIYPMGMTSLWEIVPVGDAAYVGTNPRPLDAPETYGLWYLADGDVTEVSGPWDGIQRQILGVAVDRAGTVWLGGQGGLWSWDGVDARHHMTNTFNAFSVGFVLPAPDGSVFAGDCSHVSRLANGTWSALPDPPTDMSNCRAVADDVVLWLAGWEGIASFDGTQWTRYLEDSTGEAWVHLYPRVDMGEGEEPPRWDIALSAGEVRAAMLRTDRMWVFRGGVWRPEINVLPGWAGTITDLASGDEGTLWMLSQHGVHSLIDGSWSHHRVGAGGPPEDAYALGSGGGVVWVGAWGEQARFDGAEWTTFEPSSLWFDYGVFVDPAGGVWGIDAEGTVRFDGTSTYRFAGVYAGQEFMRVLAIDADGAWWLAGGEAVYRWEPSS